MSNSAQSPFHLDPFVPSGGDFIRWVGAKDLWRTSRDDSDC